MNANDNSTQWGTGADDWDGAPVVDRWVKEAARVRDLMSLTRGGFDVRQGIPTHKELLPFDAILERMRAMQQAKDADYSGERPYGNLHACERLGVPAFQGVMVRMSDKWERIVNLMEKDPVVADEKIEDTLLDLACYAVIALVVREQSKQKARGGL